MNRIFGKEVRNCYDALDLTGPVWLLIGVGAVVVVVGVITVVDKRDGRLAAEAEGTRSRTRRVGIADRPEPCH